MVATNGLDIAAFAIAVVGVSLLVLQATAQEDSTPLTWRRPGRVAARYGLGIGLFAGALALVSWGFAGYVSNMLDWANQNEAATPGVALLYFWLGVGVAHAPLAGLTVYRSTRRFGFGIISGVLAGLLFAVGTAIGVICLIAGLPSMLGAASTAPGSIFVAVAAFSAILVISWLLPSAVLAALGCVAAMIFYPSRGVP
jgi:hypothetical protein